MSRIDVRLLGEGECEIVHRESGTRIRSSMTPEYGGKGGTFSSTDLLAAALGSCIATNLEPVAARHDVPLEAVRVSVEKKLGVSPKRVESLAVRVDVTVPASDDVLTRLSRAARHCLVHRSLSPEVEVGIDVSGPGG